jgi:hypothetical protein
MRSKPRDQGIMTRVISGVLPNGSTTGPEFVTTRLGLGDYTVRVTPPRRITSVTASPSTGALGYGVVATTTSDPAVVSIKTFTTTAAAAIDANCNFALTVAEP